MIFSEQDKKEYAQYLNRQIKAENKMPKTIAKMFNLNNLYEDLNNIEGNEQRNAA